jgi:sugar phosphate isomerase/epimerase
MCDVPHAFPPLTADKIASIKNSIQKNEITISNLNGFMMCAVGDFHNPSWIDPNPNIRRQRIMHTINCIYLAKQLDAKTISTEPGGPVANVSRQDAYDIFKEGLDEALIAAERNKVKLLIEPEPDLLIENSSQFLNFISRFDSKHLGLNFDVGHFFCVGEDPALLIKSLKDYISHVHLEDISQERVHHHLIPGKGSINFNDIFSALNSIDYKEFVTVELYPYQNNPVDAATEALQFLKNNILC